MAEANPYVAPNSCVSGASSHDGALRIPMRLLLSWLAAFGYPVLATISFYSSWVIAWLSLGHAPRPALDDPKSIGGIMDLAYVISMLAIVTAPVLLPLCFISSFIGPFRISKYRWIDKSFLAATYIAVSVLLCIMILSDPGRVMEWLLD